MRRSGMTLIEVLVAIFVMGLGLIAILALFPIGVLRMAQAIQDSRMGNIAKTADGIAATLPRPAWNTAITYLQGDEVNYNGTGYRSIKVGSNSGNQPDVSPADWTTATARGIRTDPRVISLGSSTDAFNAPATGYAADPNGQSFPVLVDPTGYAVTGEGAVAGAAWIRRRSVSSVINSPAATQTQAAVRWFTFLDDIYFDTNGTPRLTGTTFERDYRYSWAYMLQRPDTSNINTVDMKVVVFNKRPLALTSGLTLPETLYSNSEFDFGRNVVKITHSGVYPQVRPGGWILDATRFPINGPTYTTANANFYRVVAVNDLDANTVELEVQTRFRDQQQTAGPRDVIILEGVAEVFERGTGRP